MISELCASPKLVNEAYAIAEPLVELCPHADARNPLISPPPTSPPFLSGGDTSSPYTRLSGRIDGSSVE